MTRPLQFSLAIAFAVVLSVNVCHAFGPFGGSAPSFRVPKTRYVDPLNRNNAFGRKFETGIRLPNHPDFRRSDDSAYTWRSEHDSQFGNGRNRNRNQQRPGGLGISRPQRAPINYRFGGFRNLNSNQYRMLQNVRRQIRN